MKDMTTGIEMTTFTTMEGDVLTTDTQPIITIDDSTFGDTTLNIIDCHPQTRTKFFLTIFW